MAFKFIAGWRPDTPDKRDKYWRLAKASPAVSYIDQRFMLPKEIYDQKNLGSCTGQAIAAALEAVMFKNNNRWKFRPSRLDIYWKERYMEGTVMIDNGAMIRDGIKAVNKWGVCPEYMWHYSDDPIRFRLRPPQKCWESSKLHRTFSYARIPVDENSIKDVLVSGYPIIFGAMLYDSFMKIDKTGSVPMPDVMKENMRGGHAMLICGYDDARQAYIVRNSWGSDWGDGGYCYMPYEYVNDINFCDDFWVIYSVTDTMIKNKVAA